MAVYNNSLRKQINTQGDTAYEEVDAHGTWLEDARVMWRVVENIPAQQTLSNE